MGRIVNLDCTAPVPAGHRVQVRILKEPDKGFFSRRVGAKHQVKQPWLKDLDTGVEYGVWWMYEDGSMIRNEPGIEYAMSLRSELEEVERFEGKVKRTSIMTIGSAGGGGDWRQQTRIELE